MSPEEDEAWLAYFYPETVNEAGFGVLRNNLDIHDFNELQVAEYELVDMRSRQLLEGSVQIPLVQDVLYLQNVHRHLFQDVYPWAGEFRTVNIRKDGSVFASKDLLGSYLRPLMRTMVETPWERLEHERFVFASAFIFGELNHSHPFREGNGRMTRAVLHELSKPSTFELDFNQVSIEEWNAMARASMPGLGGIMSNPEPAMDVFRQVAIPRTTPMPEQKVQAAQDVTQVLSAGSQSAATVDKTAGADPDTPATPAAVTDPSKAMTAPYRQPRRLSEITKEMMKQNPAPAQQTEAQQPTPPPSLQVQQPAREHEY